MKDYDAIVVGAGNSGLIAAMELIKKGKRTLIIEQNNYPGGCATSFVRGRFEIEPSLHELCGFGSDDHDGSLVRLFKDFGIQCPWISIKDCFRAIGKYSDGTSFDITLPNGKAKFIEKIEEYVPGSKDKLNLLFSVMEDIHNGLSYISDNRKYSVLHLIRNYPALLDTSYCKCINGGIIKFVKDGQTKGEFDMSRNSDGQGIKLREDDAPKFPSELVLDAIEFVPVLGSIVGIGRSAMKGDWAMVGLNVGFLALDVFTAGAGSTLAKIGVKGGTKSIAKSATKEIGKQTAKQVEKVAVKKSAKQTSEAVVKSDFKLGQLTLEENMKNVIAKEPENALEEFVISSGKNIFVTEVAQTGADVIVKSSSQFTIEVLSDFPDLMTALRNHIFVAGPECLFGKSIKQIGEFLLKESKDIQKINSLEKEIAFSKRTT